VGEKGVLGEPTTTNLTPATGSTTTPASTASSVSGMFGQVAATVQVSLTPLLYHICKPAHLAHTTVPTYRLRTDSSQNTFNQITHTIDEKTAAPTHPGIITQITNAIEKGTERVDAFLDKVI
jgi:hypothetical protein